MHLISFNIFLLFDDYQVRNERNLVSLFTKLNLSNITFSSKKCNSTTLDSCFVSQTFSKGFKFFDFFGSIDFSNSLRTFEGIPADTVGLSIFIRLQLDSVTQPSPPRPPPKPA